MFIMCLCQGPISSRADLVRPCIPWRSECHYMIFLCLWLAPVSRTDWRQVVTGLAGFCRLAYMILFGDCAARAALLCDLASGLQREAHVLLAGGGCVHKASVVCSLLPSLVYCIAAQAADPLLCSQQTGSNNKRCISPARLPQGHATAEYLQFCAEKSS